MLEGHEIDWRRNLAVTTASVAYASGVYVKFLKFLGRFGEGTVKAVVTKVALDNFLTTPLVYFPMFYYTTGLIKGYSLGETQALLKNEYWNSYIPCLGYVCARAGGLGCRADASTCGAQPLDPRTNTELLARATGDENSVRVLH